MTFTSTSIAKALQELPDRHAQYADAYATAAMKHAALGMDPLQFAFLHAGIIERESRAGMLLRPRGPGGTGDPSSRFYDEVPDWAEELKLWHGDTDPETGKFEIVPPAFAGATVPGWGYGLGQIDFVSFRNWLSTHDWKDPYINLDKSAEILSVGMEQTGDIRLGVAAYNAGVVAVRRHPDNPDVVTTGKDYSAFVLDRANEYGFTLARVA